MIPRSTQVSPSCFNVSRGLPGFIGGRRIAFSSMAYVLQSCGQRGDGSGEKVEAIVKEMGACVE